MSRATGPFLQVVEGPFPVAKLVGHQRPREPQQSLPPKPERPAERATPRPSLPQIRSDEYRDVVGAPPPLLVRSGAMVAAIAVATVFLTACLVPYPSILNGRAQVISAQLPVTLISRGTGKLAVLAVKDGDLVERNDLLAVIDEGSDARQMLELEGWLSGAPTDVSGGRPLPAPPAVQPAKIGPAAGPLLAVLQALEDLTSFRASTDTAEQVAQLRRVVDSYSQLAAQFRDKETAAEASLQAEQRMQAGRETLVARGLAANAYLDRFESGKQTQRERVANARIDTARNLATVATTEREISGLLAAQHDRDRELSGRLAASLRGLRGVIQEWERVNVIRASQSGRLRLFGVWSDSQNLKSGDTFAIIEPAVTTPAAFAFVPATGFGKIRIGQRVTIRLDAYPRAEYGFLEARIAAVSSVALHGKYRVQFELPNGLQLSSGKSVQFSENMDGDARIEVDSRQLIQQLLSQLLTPFG
jgi:multidrug efflux pump subunit AcrA (membrane-fusion protein)